MAATFDPTAEMLDVVDDNDAIVGRCSRAEVHARQLMHRAVHVLVFSDIGQLLLQKRSMLKDECAGLWDSSCAGHVDSGDDYLPTAVRELGEELGIAVAPTDLRYLFKMSPNADNGWEFAAVYQLIHNGPFIAAADEIDCLEWVDAGALGDWAARQAVELTSGFQQIWTRFQSQNPK